MDFLRSTQSTGYIRGWAVYYPHHQPLGGYVGTVWGGGELEYADCWGTEILVPSSSMKPSTMMSSTLKIDSRT